MGMGKLQGNAKTFINEQTYPQDAYGEETTPYARVWRACLDEAATFDAEMIDGWKDTTDVLLVFVGYHSPPVSYSNGADRALIGWSVLSSRNDFCGANGAVVAT